MAPMYTVQLNKIVDELQNFERIVKHEQVVEMK